MLRWMRTPRRPHQFVDSSWFLPPVRSLHQAFTNSERANVAEVVAASEAAVEPVEFYRSDWTEGRKSPKAALHISNEWLESWTLSLRISGIDGLIGVSRRVFWTWSLHQELQLQLALPTASHVNHPGNVEDQEHRACNKNIANYSCKNSIYLFHMIQPTDSNVKVLLLQLLQLLLQLKCSIILTPSCTQVPGSPHLDHLKLEAKPSLDDQMPWVARWLSNFLCSLKNHLLSRLLFGIFCLCLTPNSPPVAASRQLTSFPARQLALQGSTLKGPTSRMWNSSIKARNKPQKKRRCVKENGKVETWPTSNNWGNSAFDRLLPGSRLQKHHGFLGFSWSFHMFECQAQVKERSYVIWLIWLSQKNKVPTSFSFSRKSRPKLPAVFRLFPPLKFHICQVADSEWFRFTSWVAFVILLDRGLHKRTQKICMNFFQNPSIHLLLKHFNRFNSSNQDPPWDRCQESVASLGVSTPPQDAPPATIKTTWY